MNPPKTVRVTVELSSTFLKILDKSLGPLNWLANPSSPAKVLVAAIRASAAHGGGFPELCTVPGVYRPDLRILHDERRVYEDGKQTFGPCFELSDMIFSELDRQREAAESGEDSDRRQLERMTTLMGVSDEVKA